MNLTAMRVAAATTLAAAMVLGPAVWRAEAQGSRTAPEQSAVQPKSAEEVRADLQQVLQQYSPALGRVLVLDPTLLGNKTYLESYPVLQKFLATRPEVVRDPNYFLAAYQSSAQSFGPADPELELRRESISAWRWTMQMVMTFGGFALFALALGWMIKYVTDHRRWLRTTRTQSDVHTKLLERMASSNDLKSYMESEAGQRFLQGSPLAVNQQTVGAPFSRILWSVQVGVVMIALGLGFLFVRRGLETMAYQMLGTWGTLAIALGIGFLLSGTASYAISSRLGLLDQKR